VEEGTAPEGTREPGAVEAGIMAVQRCRSWLSSQEEDGSWRRMMMMWLSFLACGSGLVTG
jgi:hypothetical protein